MNILFFTNSFLPRIGGVEWSVYKLSTALSELGHSIVIITEFKDEFHQAVTQYEKLDGVNIYRFKVRRSRPFTRFFIWRWIYLHRQLIKNSDVIHFHDYGTFIHWFSPFRFFYRNKLYVITHHGFDSYPIKFKDKFLRYLTDIMMDCHVGVGDYLQKYYHRKKDYTFIGAPVFSKHEVVLRKGHEILFVGRLEKDTDFDEYLRVLREISEEENFPIHLTVCGNGSLKTLIAKYTTKNFVINFVGSNAEIEKYFDRADIVCASSYLSILDAMNTQRPVVIYASSIIKRDYILSVPDILQTSFVAFNKQELKNIILTALNNYEVRNAKVQTANQFLKSLSWKNIASKHIEMYQMKLENRI